MRRGWWLALCAAMIGCGPGDEAKKAEPKKAAVKNETAPDVFTVNFDTSKGPVAVEVHRDWAPHGVDHLYNLVKAGYYDGNRLYPVTRAYAQFGVHGDPKVNNMWSMVQIAPDPVKQSNVKGTLTFAQTNSGTRTTQLFFNLRDNKDLDKSFAPIGKVTSGMDAVESFYNAYGDWPPRGQGPEPAKIQSEGNAYLEAHFPRLDFIRKASVQ